MNGTRSLVIKNELMIYGPIDPYDSLDGVRAIDVIDSINAISGDTVTVRINSPGGSVSEGVAIYNALRADGRRIVVRVDAIAASIASIIAMAGDEIIMADNAQIMVHEPWSVVAGTSKDMRKLADTIDQMKEIVLSIYEKRTGKARDDIAHMMAQETYMSASEAVEFGFADAIDLPLKIAASAPLSTEMMAKLVLANLNLPRGQGGETKEPVMAEVEITNPPEDPVANTEEAVVETTEEVVEEVVAEAEPDVQASIPNPFGKALTSVFALASKFSVPHEFTMKLIADGDDINSIKEKVMNKAQEILASGAGPEIKTALHVTQDETVVRAQRMEKALVAKFSGATADVSADARDYMDMPLYAMAGERVGHRGALYSTASRENVIRMAMHSTSDFPILLENALNKALAARYAIQAPTYRQISRQRSFADFRPHTTIRLGDFPMLQPVDEGGEIRSGTFSESKETISVKAYGVQVALTRQLLVNDNLNGIQNILNTRAEMVAQFEERTFYAMMLTATGAGPTLLETTRPVFNATDGTLATASTIDIANLGKMRAAMRKFKTLDGYPINVSPSILLCGPDMETLAQQYIGGINPNQAPYFNPFSGSMRLIVSAQITGNAWYVFADPSSVADFEWGLLDGYTAPRFRTEDPFGVQGIKLSLEHDFGVGAVDYRAGIRNAGTP